MKLEVEKSIYSIAGNNIDRYTISNEKDVSISILNYGGIISKISVPDKNKKSENIILGFEDVSKYFCKEYTDNYPYWGAICGRCANRIGDGRFTLDGQVIELNKNNNGSHLHGGNEGFDRKFWDVKVEKQSESIKLILHYISKDGEENYPGELDCTVIYELNENHTFSINYKAKTTKPTPVNLTNHTYFNLSGNQTDISKMRLQVNAKLFTPLNDKLVPLGTIESTKGTKYDLFTPVLLEDGFKILPEGYDFNYVLYDSRKLKHACILKDEENGRKLEVFTTQQGIQVYSGYWVPKIGNIGGKFSGIALETQHFPDAPNKPHFPNIILRPADEYSETTIWKFSF